MKWRCSNSAFVTCPLLTFTACVFTLRNSWAAVGDHTESRGREWTSSLASERQINAFQTPFVLVFPGYSPHLCPSVPQKFCSRRQMPRAFPSHKNATFLIMCENFFTFSHWWETYRISRAINRPLTERNRRGRVKCADGRVIVECGLRLRSVREVCRLVIVECGLRQRSVREVCRLRLRSVREVCR
jgi:hypothetical protein